VTAAAELGIPLTVLQVDSEQAAQVYDHKLVLCRPDGHIAWRGNTEPSGPRDLLRHITGAGGTIRRSRDGRADQQRAAADPDPPATPAPANMR
jgi:hypothetical protein